jgi:hypothetical protein
LEITSAIGKWHLATHIAEFFLKFTLNFVEGAGQVEGEILEIMWYGMDEMAGLALTMSIVHLVDDYMNDRNWGEIIQIGRKL